MTRRQLQRARGYTLIELLVVIAILGIVSTLLIPALSYALLKARATKLVTDFKVVEAATIDYYTAHGEWPRQARWGREPAELAPYLQGKVQWRTASYQLRYMNWIRPDGTPRRPRTGVGVGLAIGRADRDNRLTRMINRVWDGPSWMQRNGRRIILIISPGGL